MKILPEYHLNNLRTILLFFIKNKKSKNSNGFINSINLKFFNFNFAKIFFFLGELEKQI